MSSIASAFAIDLNKSDHQIHYFEEVCNLTLNHPESFKILYMLLYDFGGFRLVECSHHVFTWGLMSQFC